MNAKTPDDRPDIPQLIAILGASAPKLIIRFAPLLFRFKQQAKKGAHIFHTELLKQGIAEETAERLTAQYLESSDLLQLFRFFQ
jgi:hypothetical protein